MKSLKQLLEASLLDIDANLDVTDNEAKIEAIAQFINDNYRTKEFTISDKPNKDGKYEVSSKYSVTVKNKNITSLTNDLFAWDTVKDGFYCYNCNSLKSLEGAPKKVGGSFDCSICSSLKSLEGGPKEVKHDFYCFKCDSLESLEGAPEKVAWHFNCCNCRSLESLEGAPKEVGEYFVCAGCKGKFKESDVIAVSNVKGKIIV